MRLRPARVLARPVSIAVAAAVSGTLAWAPSASAAPQADRFGPGYPIADSDGNAATSHIGAYGPPGMRVHGDWETYCGDPGKAGPDEAAGYGAPVATAQWTSSVTGRQVPDAQVAYASYVIGRYGQTQKAAQAAAVDAVVYDMLAGGTYGINGVRGKQRLAYPNVSTTSRTLALEYIAEAKKYAGPYTLTVSPKTKQTPAGQKVEVSVEVTATLSGAKVPGVQVKLTEAGEKGESGQVTTGADGTAHWSFTAEKKGTASVEASADKLPGSGLKVLTPRDPRAQRMLLAGDTSTAKAAATVEVTAPPGGVQIRKKDPEGSRMAGVAFELIDAGGKTAARGTTDSEGILAFDNLPAGTYVLRETNSNSPLHTVVPDQRIVIAAGKTAAANPVVIVDPFKGADLTLKKIDKDSGKALPGAVINIAADTVGADGKHSPGKKVASVTTGPDGTATVKLGVLLKAGTTYWAAEIEAPTGYELNTEPQQFTAKPADRVEVTIADTKTPTRPPSTPPAAAEQPKPPAPQPPAPTAQLAHTGGGSITWALGAGAVLLVGGGATAWAARRRKSTGSPAS
ncbi:SpaA isopeptide-forming pilin-related protein [Streptomyces sp. BE147]|uniref:MSCRAMM family protein n=1 Tax=Streptomyces sp. BE147 TaxID=3002524 RepID=UPI002E759D0B|nr:SpaA isopeptide-forming pilin-related protein [Streptomyces sp. BE147]MEE1736446.1 SpaA isopeptide-forming pilin-related protein [Streptomyces sp. BE147]